MGKSYGRVLLMESDVLLIEEANAVTLDNLRLRCAEARVAGKTDALAYYEERLRVFASEVAGMKIRAGTVAFSEDDLGTLCGRLSHELGMDVVRRLDLARAPGRESQEAEQESAKLRQIEALLGRMRAPFRADTSQDADEE